MTSERQATPEKTFVHAMLPWLVAAGALLIYLVTINPWVSFSSLPQVARISGWTWQPEVFGPLFWLVTYPLRWLPASIIPLALNIFAAVCGALTLALLARSVALLPHDRTHEQRQCELSRSSRLSIPSAWLPPVLAAIVCGLQLTYWECATAATSQAPPWGSGCEMLDLLLFAYVVRCLLEFRIEERESWLLRAALAYGVGMTDNWAMVGFLPAFVVALVWLKGLSFFNLSFLTRMSVVALAGVSLYLLLPVVQGLSDNSSVSFWPALKANVTAQKSILSLFYRFGRHDVALLALTSLVPVFIMGIRWASYFGDTSRIGVTATTIMFHVVHALFLVACIWVALDPPFSPRNKGFGSPFLTFYFLGALTVGYCSGYFLLLFGKKPDRRRRQPSHIRLLNRIVTGAVYLLLLVTPVALIARNLPQISLTNGPMLKRYAALLAKGLPAQKVVALTDDSRRAFLLQAYAAGTGKLKDYLILDTSSLLYPDYHRFLKKMHPRRWQSDPPKAVVQQADPLMLMQLISGLAQTNSVYYLQPSFGYYFELFYLEPHGLAYKLEGYPTNALFAPPPSKELLAQNEAFWAEIDKPTLQPLVRALGNSGLGGKSSVWDNLTEQAHLVREVNRDATTLAAFYSRALDYWGAEMQKSSNLTSAAAHFDRALELNPDNLVAQVNLECNKKLQAGEKSAVQLSKSIEDQFGKYRKWDDIIGENGPFDEPNFCFEQGRTYLGNSLFRQAAAQFQRVSVLSPENLAARLWLGQLYVLARMPDKALHLVDQIREQPELADVARTNRSEILMVETAAQLAKGDLGAADKAVQRTVKKYPGDEAVLATATQVYLKYEQYSNALVTLNQQLQISPTNINTLINKGYVCIQVGAFDQAIPPLTQVLAIESTNYPAMINLAIALLRAGKLETSQRYYETLQKAFPTSHLIYFGLAEIAWQRKDTNAAVRNYQLYQANAPTNTTEFKLVSDRLKELRPRSP
jgi:tetratricopeptide (TPR) repeat protein